MKPQLATAHNALRLLRRRCQVSLFTLLVASCKTIPIPQNPPIPVPPGLTEEQVGAAIIAAALEPPKNDPQWFNAFVTNNPLAAGIWQSMHESGDSNLGWFPESQQPGLIYAGYAQGEYYLQVAISYDTTRVSTKIVSSRNLDQTKTQIHKGVVRWLDRLEDRIRRALGMMAIGQGRTTAPSRTP